MKARLAAVALLAALIAPSTSAQFIYVANAGEDTVSKIDINPPYNEVARYATWFTPGSPNHIPPHDAWTGPAPSRIARDSAGNVYVLDRFFPERPPAALNQAHLPVLLKIAPTGGTTTSTGPAVLSMTDTNNDNHIDLPPEVTDQRITWAKEIGIAGTDEGALGRALCMDPSGFLWVGMYKTQRYYKVDPANGQVLGPPVELGPPAFNPGHTPYGCQVDAKGKLWSVDEQHTLAEIDTTTNKVVKIHDHGSNPGPPATDFGQNYSVSIFNGCGSAPTKVYLADMSTGGPSPAPQPKTYIVYDPQTSSFSNAPSTIPQFASVAIAVDRNGDIVSGEWFTTGRVIKTTPGGIVLWDTDTLPAGPAVKTAQLRGIIIDEHNDVWAVHLMDNRVVKYSGGDGHVITTVKVGKSPYTYSNAPPPICPCAQTSEPQIKCKGKNDKGEWEYSWSFVVTNHSPFSMPATGIDISSTQVTNLIPTQFAFTPAVPPNGQATVSGTFTLGQPVAGSQVCFDIRLNFGEVGWCCPTEHICFIVPDCTCASLQGVFRCSNGSLYLELSVTNLGPTTAAGAQIFSNTPGVTVSPATTTLAFPQNTAVPIPLTVTGATLGQVISLSVMLHGPIDPKTGVHSWCCTAVVKVTYPIFLLCWWPPGGWLFDDINANGLRDSGEGGLAEWTVTLTDAKGTPHTTKSDASGKYQFKEIEPGKSRLSVQPPKGWRATTSKGGFQPLSVEAPPKEKLDFGFVKTR